MFGLGPMELIIIGVIAVLLFGDRLPEVGKSVGKSFMEFKRGLGQIEREINVATSIEPTRRPAPRTQSIDDQREEPLAPKFEPPPAEPQATPSTSQEAPKA